MDQFWCHPMPTNFQRICPLADSFIESRCPSVCLFPSHAIFLEASHWPSDNMIRSCSPRWELLHHMQSPDETDEKMCSWLPSELCLFDENSSINCNLLMKLMKKCFPGGHYSSVSSMRTCPSPVISWWTKNVNPPSPKTVSVLLSASVERFFVSHMQDFCY